MVRTAVHGDRRVRWSALWGCCGRECGAVEGEPIMMSILESVWSNELVLW